MTTKTPIFYLGVEGGATKSTALLANEHRVVIKTKRGKSLNYHTIGEQLAKKNLRSLIAPLIKQVKGGKLTAAFGLAGNDTRKDEQTYERMIRSLLPKGTKFVVVNDAKIALEARCMGQSRRLLAISGTGANVYGENQGKSTRAIGWDYILGDEGGGYYTGLAILRAVTRAVDGRGEQTMLLRLVLEQNDAKTFDELIPLIYKKAKGTDYKRYIASFSKLLDIAIGHRDPVALEIREHVADELAKGAEAVMKRLNMKDKEVAVGIMGSNWKMPGLIERFEKKVKKTNKNIILIKSDEEGAQGALILAAAL